MPQRPPPRTPLTPVLGLLFGLLAATARADDEAYAKLLAEKAPAAVTVKFLLKVNTGGMFGSSQEEETESEINGVLINPKGLVLCSNTQLAGFVGMMKRFMGGMGAGITATPTDIKVLAGDDSEGRAAEIVARDTELDLAWVRIKEPGEHAFPYVDFAQGAAAKIGQTVLGVHRLGKFFARSAVVSDGRIAGTTTKPRDLLVPSATVGAGFGMPVFTTDGKPVGVVVMQAPESEGGDVNPMAMLGRMSGMQEMMGGFILPATEVVKATKRALETEAGK